MNHFKNILVYRIGHLGDTLVSLPAFWAIRQTHREAQITLLTNSNASNSKYVLARNVLPKKGLFDDWMVYPSNVGKIHSLVAFSKLFLEIRRRNFDVVFYLTTRNRTISQINRDIKFFRLAGINEIVGTEYLLENLLDNRIAKPLPFVETEKDFLLNCLKLSRFPLTNIENSKPELLLDEEENSKSKNWLEETCGNYLSGNKLLAVAPSGKWESKIWAEKSFAQVVQEMIEVEDVFPVIFGGAEDREKGNRLIKIWKRGANAAGILNIREAAAALAWCRVYLGNDTGTMHLAASVGTPCVAVFSAIDWAGRWIPFGKNHKIFRETVPCEGCLSSVCKFQHECLRAINPGSVFIECLDLWRSGLRSN